LDQVGYEVRRPEPVGLGLVCVPIGCCTSLLYAAATPDGLGDDRPPTMLVDNRLRSRIKIIEVGVRLAAF
jgi:hypothetical protein